MVAEVIDNTTSRGRTLRFLYDGPHDEFKKALFALGVAPLPEDFKRLRKEEPEDLQNFQTYFAKKEGSVTASFAGLHFTRELMKRMEIRGIDTAFVTMHTGLGSFREIDVEDLTKHKMDSDLISVDTEAVQLINKAKAENRKICAVGTSVQRVLETASLTGGMLKEYDGWTSKFIFPEYNFQVANCMIANFYAPYSTMLMLTTAFGGYDNVMNAYKVALDEGYRFGLYGDAMLIID